MTSTIDLSKLPPDTDDFSQIWPYIKAGVHRLLDSSKEITSTEFMNLWVLVCDVGKSKAHAVELQRKLKELFVERVQPVTKEAAEMVDMDFLRYYVTEFHRYKADVERVDRAFGFYNRWTADGRGSVLPVYLLAMTQWKENCAMIMQKDGAKITSMILHLIMKEPGCGNAEESLVKNALDSLIVDHHGFVIEIVNYKEEFETPFLRMTTDYYTKELEVVFQSENFVSDYLNKFEESLLDEQRRFERYLPKETHDKVIRTVLINHHCEALAQRLLETKEDRELARMYRLLSGVKPDGLEPLKKRFKLYVERPEPTASDIRQRHLELAGQCFQSDLEFKAVLRQELGPTVVEVDDGFYPSPYLEPGFPGQPPMANSGWGFPTEYRSGQGPSDVEDMIPVCNDLPISGKKKKK